MNKEKIFNIFKENWTNVLKMIISKEPVITIKESEKIDKNKVKELISGFNNTLVLYYGDSEKDYIIISVNNKMISIISNLMMGIDTFKDEIDNDDKDAFKEAVNQMFSSCQVPFKEQLGIEMKFRDLDFKTTDEIDTQLIERDYIILNINVGIEEAGDEKVIITLPAGFFEASFEESEEEIEQEVETYDENDYNDYGEEYSGTNIDLLLDVELPITVRIGTTEMKLIDIMRLGIGSIIEFVKMVDDPIEVLVNDKLVAKGEVVVYDSNFAIRITEVDSKENRIKSLGG